MGQASSPPLSGNYIIACTDSYGIVHRTNEMPYDTGLIYVMLEMEKTIPFLIDNIDLYYDYRFAKNGDGISFLIRFTGLYYEVPLCSIESGFETLLTGNEIY